MEHALIVLVYSVSALTVAVAGISYVRFIRELKDLVMRGWAI